MMEPWDKKAMIQLLEERGISDRRVLDAMASVPREMFVPAAFRDEAWMDAALPIECQQTISQPYVVAYMTERLQVSPGHDVLEIGTGSGYQAAILARLARHVYTIERHEALHRVAVQRFRRLGLENVTAIVGDGMKGWPEPRSFHRIIVTAAAPEIPEALASQLAAGGLMIVPVGGRKMQRLMLVTRPGEKIETQELLPVRFVPLLPDGEGPGG
jgi:protein-L-isoaspartate(D-aspartate) O-methyltransferase